MDNTIRQKYDLTEEECPLCEEGRLWANSFELYCDNCDSVLRGEDSDFEKFGEDVFSNRTDYRYNGSKKIMLFGGFPSAYNGEGLYGT